MIYRFEGYQLDDELFELRSSDELIGLPRKSFDLLRYLLEHSDRVVSKQELFSAIWPSQHVTETVLPVNIRTIRKALGEELSERVLKNVRGRGYRITCRVERTSHAGATSGPVLRVRSSFVGRASVMEGIAEDCATALEGHGRLVLLYGDAGVGKTRILDEVSQAADPRSSLALHVRCPEDDGAPPFWPVLQLLRAAYRELREEPRRSSLAQQDFDLDRVRGTVAEMLGDDLLRRVDPGAARFRLVQAVVRMLGQLSRALPVILLVDDLQCADEGTLQVAEAVVRELDSMPVFIVAAYRDSDLRRGSAMARMMGAISGLPCLRPVRLRGLSVEEIEEFVRQETGQESPEGLGSALSEHTEGNPFFVRETLRLLVSEGELRTQSDPAVAALGLPQGIRDAIGRRLGKLSLEGLEMLRWASVIGRRFSFPVLEQVCGLDGHRLLELLSEVEEARIISSDGDGRDDVPLALGEFAFAHGLIREAIYEEMSGPERVLRHRATAEACERLYGQGVGSELFDLARHFFQAAPGGDISKAVDYSLRAARYAFAHYAYEEAVRQFDRAVRSEDLRVPRDDLRYCALAMNRAGALWRAEQYDAAEEGFMRAADIARALGRFDLLGYCVLGLVGWPRFNRRARGAHDPEIARARVRTLAEEALGGLGESDLALRSRLTGTLVRTERAGSKRQIGLGDRAIELARKSGDERALFHALMSKRAALVEPGQLREALQLAKEAVDLGRRLGALPRLFAAYEARIPLLFAVGDMVAADLDLAAAEAIANDIRLPVFAYVISRFQLARAEGQGRSELIPGLVERVTQLGREAGDDDARRCSTRLRLWMLGAQGRVRDLRQELKGGPEVADVLQSASSGAYFSMLAGDRSACQAHFERAAQAGFEGPPLGVNWLWRMCAFADVCCFLGDRERAEVLYELLLPYKGINVVTDLYLYRGAAATPLGRLAYLLRRRDQAAELFEIGLEFNERIGAFKSLVWTRMVYTAMLRRGTPRDRRRAEEISQTLQEDAQQLGMSGLLR